MTEQETYITDETIVENIVCRSCNNTLPPHTVKEHLDVNNPIHKCPHKIEKLRDIKNLKNGRNIQNN